MNKRNKYLIIVNITLSIGLIFSIYQNIRESTGGFHYLPVESLTDSIYVYSIKLNDNKSLRFKLDSDRRLKLLELGSDDDYQSLFFFIII